MLSYLIMCVCVCVWVCECVCTSCDVVWPTFISGTSAPAVDSESRQQGRHDEQVQLQEYQSNPATWRIDFITDGSYTAERWHYTRDKMWNQY